MGKRIVIKARQDLSQSGAVSSFYRRFAYFSWGTVESLNKSLGAVNIKLNNGFIVNNIRIRSSVFPLGDVGEITYPVKGSSVILLYPEDDIKNAVLLSAPLNYRDADVKASFLDPGVDVKKIPGGWEISYDQETGDMTIENGSFSMNVSNDSEEINIQDWNGNTFNFVDGEIKINGSDDYAVAFNNLKTEFDKLNDAYNDLVGRLLGWTPVPNDGGTALKTALTMPSPIAVSGSVIDNAKVENVRLKHNGV